ncbi:hypothetical protein [Saccharothrix sp. HUAS TT1]|uniref:hypothetical protein n=1 Tax=unclassified Saccharothrix TaxID=2593673 RepID=UPI00345B7D3D
MLLGLVLPLWDDGPPVGASFALVVAGLLVKAHQVHADRPGAWFPLLVTGSTSLVVALSPPVESIPSELWRYLIGLAAAIALALWAWRARSGVVAVTALAYLTAVLRFQPVAPEPGSQFLSAEQFHALPPAFDPGSHPELVIVAGAVLAHARLDRARPWHVLAITGLLGSLWHVGAFALVAAAVVVGAHDLNARRPGAWYPLAVVGVGLVAWPVLERATAPRWTDPAFEGLPDGYYATLTYVPMNAAETSATALAISHADHDEVFAALVVAVGLAVWAWRRRSPVMLLTAVAYLSVAYLDAWSPPELVVLAGAAVALATTAAPGGVRTAGRSAGTPGRWPGP